MKKEDSKIKAEKTYIVDAEGSLGLLALGYKGVKAWKDKIKEVKNKSQNTNANESQNS